MKHITTFADFINESAVKENTHLDLSKWKIGDTVEFANGEIWKVAKPGYKKANDSIFLAPFNDVAKKKYISLPIEFTADELTNTVKESAVTEASAFMAKDVAKTVAYLTAEVGAEPGYIFFGDGEDIEDFDKLWRKRKYQEALDMLAQDREIAAQSFDDVKPWTKQN